MRKTAGTCHPLAVRRQTHTQVVVFHQLSRRLSLDDVYDDTLDPLGDGDDGEDDDEADQKDDHGSRIEWRAVHVQSIGGRRVIISLRLNRCSHLLICVHWYSAGFRECS